MQYPTLAHGVFLFNLFALAGAHIATIPYNVLVQMTKNPLTDIGIEKFLSDWNNSNKK